MEVSSASPIQPLQILPSWCLAGDWQMAIDAWMLAQRAPAFRLYRWQRPALSLGFHQHQLEPHWKELAAAGLIELVRRPSGGRAVLHAGDITYALIWPEAPPQRAEAYALACGWLIEAFARLGQPLQPGRQANGRQRSNCFASSTTADLVHADGTKRIGSAQLWHRGCLLQHGSIQVEPPTDLWRLVFGADPPALASMPLELAALETLLLEAARAALPMPTAGIQLQTLDSDAWAKIAERRSDHWVCGAGSRP